MTYRNRFVDGFKNALLIRKIGLHEFAKMLASENPNTKIIPFKLFTQEQYLIADDILNKEIHRNFTDFNKADFSKKAMGSVLGPALVSKSGEENATARRIIQSFFIKNYAKIYSIFMQLMNEAILPKIAEQMKTSTTINLSGLIKEYIHRFTVHFILGEDLMQGDLSLIETQEKIWLSLDEEFNSLLPFMPLWVPTNYNRIRKFYHKSQQDFINKVAHSRQNDDSLFGEIIRMYRDDHGKIDLYMARVESFGLVNGASETTISNIEWLMYSLGRYPNIQNNIRSELKNNPESMRTRESLSQVKSAFNAVNETLRFTSVVPINCRQLNKDLEIDGQVYNKGSVFVGGLYVANRRSKYWDNPDEYIPERWIDSGKTIEDCTAFGGGKYHCLGSQIAQISSLVFCTQFVKSVKFSTDQKMFEKHILSMSIDKELIIKCEKIS